MFVSLPAMWVAAPTSPMCVHTSLYTEEFICSIAIPLPLLPQKYIYVSVEGAHMFIQVGLIPPNYDPGSDQL